MVLASSYLLLVINGAVFGGAWDFKLVTNGAVIGGAREFTYVVSN